MDSREHSEVEPGVVEGLPTAPKPDAIVEFLRRYWGMPLRTTAEVEPLRRSTEPIEIVRDALASSDVRLVRALPCWLSLLGEFSPIPERADWSVEDRRRLAYVCELAAALRCLRERLAAPEDPDRPASVAGIEPGVWDPSIPLCRFDGPAVAPSIFGERWGIIEPMAFPEYVAFQDEHLRTSEALQGGGSR